MIKAEFSVLLSPQYQYKYLPSMYEILSRAMHEKERFSVMFYVDNNELTGDCRIYKVSHSTFQDKFFILIELNMTQESYVISKQLLTQRWTPSFVGEGVLNEDNLVSDFQLKQIVFNQGGTVNIPFVSYQS